MFPFHVLTIVKRGFKPSGHKFLMNSPKNNFSVYLRVQNMYPLPIKKSKKIKTTFVYLYLLYVDFPVQHVVY